MPAVELVTIGQRAGLGVSGAGERRYAVAVDVPGRTVTVGSPDDLLDATVELDRMVWADGPVTGAVLAQCSAHGEAAAADVEATGADTARLRWHQPRRRVAPGQSVVLYDRDQVVGGGAAR